MQIELKCSESAPNHTHCDYESYVYLSLFWITRHQATRRRQRSTNPKWTIIPARWQATDSLEQSQVAECPENMQMLSPAEGHSVLAWLWPWDGPLCKNKSQGGGVRNGWVMWVAPTKTFSKLSGPWGERAPKADKQRLMGWEGNPEVLQLNYSTGSLSWARYLSSHHAYLWLWLWLRLRVF